MIPLFCIYIGGKNIILGNYGPAWRFYRKLFITALRQYLSEIPLIESRVSTQAEKLVQFIEEQNGKPFDPADCLMRSVANVICGITFKEGSDTTNPDMNSLLKLNADRAASTDDIQLSTLLDFFPWTQYLPIKANDRLNRNMFETFDIIRKLMKEKKETFDPAEQVGDFMSALLRVRHDLEAECESDEEKAAILSEDHFVACIEDMFFGRLRNH